VNPVELLTGSSDDLVAANRRDLEIARGEVARLKTMTAPRSAAEALGAYDRAVAALADASARASVARNAHPSAAMRDAAEVCEQEVDGLPDDYRRAHPPGANGKVRITTDYPDYVPFLSYANSSAARERLWRVYRQRAHPKNLDVLARMLERRFELAGLLGHPSWASYVTEDKMIGSAQAAADFIARISAAAETRMA